MTPEEMNNDRFDRTNAPDFNETDAPAEAQAAEAALWDETGEQPSDVFTAQSAADDQPTKRFTAEAETDEQPTESFSAETAAPAQDPQPAFGHTPHTHTAKEKKRRKERKTMPRTRAAALIVCCSLLSGTVGAAVIGTVNGAGSTTLTESSRKPQTVNVSYVDTGKLMTAAEVYAANVDSTVGITTSITTNYWGYKTSAAASGSGFIVSSDGYIVTNYHVIEDSTSITVTTYTGDTYDAVLVGCDETNDLAVLKVDATGLTPVVLGNSDALNVGDDVVAIGNPLGELTFSLTKGSVSALNREVTLSSGVTMNLIQTDAAINAGNSGGALFNLYGEVIGITNAKYSGSSSQEASIDNIGFAIPLNSVKDIITSIIEKGYYAKPYIGIQVSDAADAALVYSVEANSPAEKAGLMANDIITAANGEKIGAASDLTALVKAMAPGDTLELTVRRGSEETALTVTVGEKRQDGQTARQSGTDDRQSDFGSMFGEDFGGMFGDGSGEDYGGMFGSGSEGRSGGFPFDFFSGDSGDYNKG